MTDSLRIDPPPLGSAESAAPPAVDLRTDVHTGARTYVVRSRQVRPNLPSAGCPFCPGGLEAPEDYDVRWFVNRWPAMPDRRCEVVLYTPQHDATFWSLGVAGARRVVDLWAARTSELGARDDIAYVLVFENRGAEVGATITHPHGQIYAFNDVPERPRGELERGERFPDVDDRLVATEPGLAGLGPRRRRCSRISSCSSPTTLFPTYRRSTTPAVTDSRRCSSTCSSGSTRSSRPRPRTCSGSISGRSTVASGPRRACTSRSSRPWRARGVARFVAAGELGSGVFFNPVAPEEAARALRDVRPTRR